MPIAPRLRDQVTCGRLLLWSDCLNAGRATRLAEGDPYSPGRGGPIEVIRPGDGLGRAALKV